MTMRLLGFSENAIGIGDCLPTKPYEATIRFEQGNKVGSIPGLTASHSKSGVLGRLFKPVFCAVFVPIMLFLDYLVASSLDSIADPGPFLTFAVLFLAGNILMVIAGL
jgi:hypothetical protein